MAKKVVASLRDKSGVKYAKLIKSVKSEKTGAYVFKEEIVIEDYVKDILAGKTHEPTNPRTHPRTHEPPRIHEPTNPRTAPTTPRIHEPPAPTTPRIQPRTPAESRP